MREYIVPEEFNQARIDRWIRAQFSSPPQSLIEKSLRSGKIKAESGKIKSSYRLTGGEKIMIYIDLQETEEEQKSEEDFFKYQKDYEVLSSQIVAEEDLYIVLNKPKGFCVQNGTNVKKSVIDIMNACRPDDNFKIVHRIDKETSGILILAKDLTYARYFTQLFREHQIHKTYLAICHGDFSHTMQAQNGIISNKIEKIGKVMQESREGKEAETSYQILSANDKYSLLELKPKTGRMHQLRVQLSLLGHPIVGDIIYGTEDAEMGMLLHAAKIEFVDINGKLCCYEAAAPSYFLEFSKQEGLDYGIV